jgi:hypothetical protein
MAGADRPGPRGGGHVGGGHRRRTACRLGSDCSIVARRFVRLVRRRHRRPAGCRGRGRATMRRPVRCACHRGDRSDDGAPFDEGDPERVRCRYRARGRHLQAQGRRGHGGADRHPRADAAPYSFLGMPGGFEAAAAPQEDRLQRPPLIPQPRWVHRHRTPGRYASGNAAETTRAGPCMSLGVTILTPYREWRLPPVPICCGGTIVEMTLRLEELASTARDGAGHYP